MVGLFGSAGIPARADTEPMTAYTALKVAMATALQFRNEGRRELVVIGKDTRLSGHMLEPALTAGFLSMGVDVALLGPIPVMAVANTTRSLRAGLGIMISGPGGSLEDDGIKLFDAEGYRLSAAAQASVEARVASLAEPDMASASDLGRAKRVADVRGRYIEWVKSTIPRGLRLDGLRIVVDCADSAAHAVAPAILSELGATVLPVAPTPDTAHRTMREAVLAYGADIGLALDAAGDRAVLTDERGQAVDGDQVMALIAGSWACAGRLKGGGVVGTVMSNLGLERHLGAIGLHLARTPAGDRHVVERMRTGGYNVGGERSGHIVLGDHGTTGDGLTTALQVLAAMVRDDARASEACRVFEPLPQALRNIPCRDLRIMERPRTQAIIADAEAGLAGSGRLLVRRSGSEPMVRVMVEGDNPALVAGIADNLASVIAGLDAAGGHAVA